jgi:Mn-containing catalase
MEADQLRDLLHAEKQLLKALPRMAQSARFTQLKGLFELHPDRPNTKWSASRAAKMLAAVE